MVSGSFSRCLATIAICSVITTYPYTAQDPSQGSKAESVETRQDATEQPALSPQQRDEVRRIVRDEADKLKAILLKDFATTQELANSEAYVDSVKKTLTDLESRVAGIERRLSALETSFRNEIELLQTRVSKMDDRLNSVVTSDSSENSFVAIRGQMDASQEFRKQFGEAIADTRTGLVTIQNLSDQDHELYINGKKYAVPLYQTITVSVPVGALVTELWPYERPKTWVLNASNDFMQDIKIYPRLGPPAPSPFRDPPDRGMRLD
jgi:hypothetical protein